MPLRNVSKPLPTSTGIEIYWPTGHCRSAFSKRPAKIPPGLTPTNGGNSRPPASTRRAATDHRETTAPSTSRSSAMDPSIERLVELAAGSADRDARHRGAVAPARVRRLLALELATPPRRSAGAGRWPPGVDSPDARRQPTLGSASHYTILRQAGHAHPRALRGVADRLLAVLIGMLKSNILYDHQRRRTAAA